MILVTYGFKYFNIGYESGEMVVKVLKGGAKPADIAVQNPRNLLLLINKDAVDTSWIEVKDE